MFDPNLPRWTNDKDKAIVEEAYRSFAVDFDRNGIPVAYQQWFNGASVIPNHPVKLGRTLEIQANYYPAAELNTLANLAAKHGIKYHIEILRG